MKLNSKYTEYIPIVLLSLMFVADEQLEHKALSMSCQTCIMVICSIIFFMLLLKFSYSKYTAFIITGVLWVLLIYIKQQYILKPLNM